MAKFRCVCGVTIRTSGEIPNPQEWHVTSDNEFTAIWERSDDNRTDLHELNIATTLMYRCPASDHLWVFWDGIENNPRLYAPTDLPSGWTEAPA